MKYKVFAKSVSGSKYTLKGWECQDSSGKLETDFIQGIAVADGHGSGDCFRSEHGSKIAIEVAFKQILLYCDAENSDEDSEPTYFSETGIINFKYAVWNEWRKVVKNHWNNYLVKENVLGETEERYKSVSEKYRARYTADDKEIVEKYLYVAYGTTLSFAVATPSQVLAMQIGDGSCVILQRDGEFRKPVPSDEDNFLNVTSSLCEDDANLKIRHTVIERGNSSTAPIAIFLSSDGVDDCYPSYMNEKYLYRLYSVIIDNIIKKGYADTEKEIEQSLLTGMTKRGSQDDISLAFFISDNIDYLEEAYKNIDEDYKTDIMVNCE